jgi:glycosyltransferase involved in cell wall biosynthesis
MPSFPSAGLTGTAFCRGTGRTLPQLAARRKNVNGTGAGPSCYRSPVHRPVVGPYKVLLFIPHLQQGGAERQILELMRRLPSRFEPTICVYRDDAADNAHYRDYLHEGTRTVSLGVDDMGVVGLRRFVKLIRDEKPAILHSYRDRANLWARVARLVTDIPVVLTSVRNRYQGPLYGPAEFLLQRQSDRVLTNSRGIEDELVNWSRVAPERIQVINNFVDLEAFRPPAPGEREAARASFGFAPEEIILLLPGRFAMQKHQLGLGVSLAILERRGRLPKHVRIVFAGRKRDKVYSRLVPPGMRLLGVGHHIEYLEPVKDMLRLYHAADALVMPSLFEGMPNAVLEAHASALPAVVSRAANRDQIVIDGVSGFEVGTIDPFGLANAIDKMVNASPEQRRQMGARGREHVSVDFHPDRILEETVALYDELLARNGVA